MCQKSVKIKLNVTKKKKVCDMKETFTWMRFDLVCIVCFFLYIFFLYCPSSKQDFNGLTIKRSNLQLTIQLLVSWVETVYFLIFETQKTCFISSNEQLSVLS